MSRTALLAALCFISPAFAQPSLEAVPSDAKLVVQVRGVERAKARSTAFLKAAFPADGGKLASQVEEQLKTLLGGRDLTQVVADAPAFLVSTRLPGPDVDEFERSLALFVRVKDFGKFKETALTADERKALKKNGMIETATVEEKTVCLLERAGYVVLTTSADTAREYAKQKRDLGLAGKLGPVLSARLTEPDVAAYLDVAAVNEKFGDAIRNMRDLLNGALGGGGNLPGVDEAQLAVAKSMFVGMFQMVADCRLVIASADFRPAGLNLRCEFRFNDGSPVAKILKPFHPGPLADFSALPAGQATYTATRLDPAMVKALGGLLLGLGLGNDPTEQVTEELLKTARGDWLSTTSFPTAGIQIVTYTEPAKAVQATTAMYQKLNGGERYQMASLKGKPELTADAAKHRDFTLHSVRLRFDLDKLVEELPDAAKKDALAAMKKLIGTEQLTWYGTDGKRFVTLTAANWGAAKLLLDAYLNGNSLAKEPAFQALRRELPEQTMMLFVADTAKLIGVFGDYLGSVTGAMPLPVPLPTIRTPTGTTRSYLGYALTLQGDEARLDLFIPNAALSTFRQSIGDDQ